MFPQDKGNDSFSSQTVSGGEQSQGSVQGRDRVGLDVYLLPLKEAPGCLSALSFLLPLLPLVLPALLNPRVLGVRSQDGAWGRRDTTPALGMTRSCFGSAVGGGSDAVSSLQPYCGAITQVLLTPCGLGMFRPNRFWMHLWREVKPQTLPSCEFLHWRSCGLELPFVV